MGGRRRRARDRRATSCRGSSPRSAARAPTTASAVALLFLRARRDDRPGVRPRDRPARAPRRPDARARCRCGTAIAGAAVGDARRAGPRLDGHPVARDRQGLAGAHGPRLVDRRRDPAMWRRDQPARFAAWGRAISDAPYPSALGPARRPRPIPGTAADDASSRPRSTPRCARVDREGDGRRVPPDPGGERLGRGAGARRDQRARRRGGALDDGRRRSRATRLPATVVVFDPVRDLAVLSVPRLNARAAAAGRRAPTATSARSTDIPAADRCRLAGARSARRSSRSAPTSTARRRAAGTCTCSRPRSRPAIPAARSSNRAATSSASRSRSTPAAAATELRAHGRRGATGAATRRRRRRTTARRHRDACLVE